MHGTPQSLQMGGSGSMYHGRQVLFTLVAGSRLLSIANLLIRFFLGSSRYSIRCLGNRCPHGFGIGDAIPDSIENPFIRWGQFIRHFVVRFTCANVASVALGFKVGI